MQNSSLELDIYQKRRKNVFKLMKKHSALLIPPNPSSKRSNDTDNRYKPNSDILYLSGYQEEDVTLLLVKNTKNMFQLSVLPRNEEMETWTGKRHGPEGAKALFNADEAFSNENFNEKLKEIFEKCFSIYYSFGINDEYDKRVLEAYKQSRMKIYKNYVGPREIIDTNQIIHEMRLVKDEFEIENLKKSCEIASQGHLVGMKYIKPGLNEYQIQAKVEQTFLENGGLHPAYPSICGTGRNATILHYISNTDQLKDGDLFLIDAGTEYNNYCSDITRTYPVNGKFSDIQAEVYNIVLESQLKGIEQCKPGNTYSSVHEEALKVLTEGLVTLGVLNGSVEELIKEEKYKPYFMHRTSHWLGLDTHDAGVSVSLDDFDEINNISSRKLVPGMVLTVEPGLYFQPHLKDISEELKGIGIRIEDDILITNDGFINLTEKVPRSIKEIEKTINST